MKKIFKITGLVFLLLVALLASIFAGKTASQYFAKAAGCPAEKIMAGSVGPNSAVINWETKDDTQGTVKYGTDPKNLNIAAEAVSGKSHSVPLTLLSPNTIYFFLVTIGKNTCDASGKSCDAKNPGGCMPWSFTTSPLIVQEENIAPIVSPSSSSDPAALISPAVSIPAMTNPVNSAASPTGEVSPPAVSGTLKGEAFCQQVKSYIGSSSSDTSNWPSRKQYDIDGNGVINGMDVIKCK